MNIALRRLIGYLTLAQSLATGSNFRDLLMKFEAGCLRDLDGMSWPEADAASWGRMRARVADTLGELLGPLTLDNEGRPGDSVTSSTALTDARAVEAIQRTT